MALFIIGFIGGVFTGILLVSLVNGSSYEDGYRHGYNRCLEQFKGEGK